MLYMLQGLISHRWKAGALHTAADSDHEARTALEVGIQYPTQYRGKCYNGLFVHGTGGCDTKRQTKAPPRQTCKRLPTHSSITLTLYRVWLREEKKKTKTRSTAQVTSSRAGRSLPAPQRVPGPSPPHPTPPPSITTPPPSVPPPRWDPSVPSHEAPCASLAAAVGGPGGCGGAWAAGWVGGGRWAGRAGHTSPRPARAPAG
jgi:hypothetical protein